MESYISSYASALYSLLDEKEREQYLSTLKGIKEDFEREKELFSLLCSYAVNQKEKEKILQKVYGNIPLKHLLPFLNLLCKKHRIIHFCEIFDAYSSLCNEERNIKEGIAYSAVALSKDQLSQIEAALSKRVQGKVQLKNILDPSLLGGVKVALDGKVYDGSLRGKLAELKKQLKGGEAS